LRHDTAKRFSVSDQKVLWGVCGIMLVLIVVMAVVRPAQSPDDPRPTTTNTGPQGAKAAFLVLQRLGLTTSQGSRSLAEFNDGMDDAQAERTTLVLAAPQYDQTELPRLRQELERFLNRGGHVLATGPSGAALLPGGDTKAPGMVQPPLCHTTPEGAGALARAGSVEMAEGAQWSDDAAKFEVEQRCGDEAAVVRYGVGKGEAVWWASAAPLENDELKNDADLKLLLASVGSGREVVFDESLHGAVKSIWDEAKGLPLRWLALQAALLFVLLVVSFSRRRGPLRSPVRLPRSSPVEFAASMGDLYEKAAASSAATEAAKRRFLRVLTREAGVAQGTIDEGPETIAEALRVRLGGDWALVSEHLREAKRAEHGEITMRSALALVRALSEDAKRVRASLAPKSSTAELQVLVGTKENV
jgi:hypothetical protein